MTQKQLRVAQTLGQYIATMDLEPAKAIQYQALGRGPAEGEGGGVHRVVLRAEGLVPLPTQYVTQLIALFFGAILRNRVSKGASVVPILISKQPDFIFFLINR